jgi:hypothetical protein
MKNKIFVSLILLLLFVACRTKQEVSKTSQLQVKELIVDKEFHPIEAENFSIYSASIDGDILTLSVNYHGGKAFHEFELLFNGIYMKSMPPQVNLFLKHSHTPENCEKLISETVHFDLKNLRLGEKGTVIIRLAGYTERLEYTY